jgi:hypothetical protein
MAWWDHEELKPMENRSLRYKLNFIEEYDRSEWSEILREAFWCGGPERQLMAKGIAKRYGIKIRVKAKSK